MFQTLALPKDNSLIIACPGGSVGDGTSTTARQGFSKGTQQPENCATTGCGVGVIRVMPAPVVSFAVNEDHAHRAIGFSPAASAAPCPAAAAAR